MSRSGVLATIEVAEAGVLVGQRLIARLQGDPWRGADGRCTASFKMRKSARRCLPFVPERVNELPVAARNVNKGGQFSVITTGSPCIGNLIEKRPSDLCPFGEDIQVIAVHVTLVTFPSRGFSEDLDFFQLHHKRGRRLVGYVEPLGDLGDGNRGCIEQLLRNPDGYRGGDLFLPQQTAMIGLEFEDLPGCIHHGAGDVHNPFQEIIHPLFIIARLPDHVQTIVVFLAIFLEIVAQVQERLV